MGGDVSKKLMPELLPLIDYLSPNETELDHVYNYDKDVVTVEDKVKTLLNLYPKLKVLLK